MDKVIPLHSDATRLRLLEAKVALLERDLKLAGKALEIQGELNEILLARLPRADA